MFVVHNYIQCTSLPLLAQVEDSAPNLSRLFSVGQLLPCYVLGVEGGTRVSLSVNPRLVNAHLTHRDIRPGMVCYDC